MLRSLALEAQKIAEKIESKLSDPTFLAAILNQKNKAESSIFFRHEIYTSLIKDIAMRAKESLPEEKYSDQEKLEKDKNEWAAFFLTILHIAAKYNFKDELQTLLAILLPNAKEWSFNGPVQSKFIEGKLTEEKQEIVQFDINKSCPLARGIESDTLLQLAAFNGHADLVKSLVSQGADPKVRVSVLSARDRVLMGGSQPQFSIGNDHQSVLDYLNGFYPPEDAKRFLHTEPQQSGWFNFWNPTKTIAVGLGMATAAVQAVTNRFK